MRTLPQVALIAIGTENFFGPTVLALLESMKHIQPASVVFFSDVSTGDTFLHAPQPVTIVPIDPIRSKEAYSYFLCKEIMKHQPYLRNATHLLIIQHDGYVLDADAWDDEYLNYDYIGAPWDYKDGRNVGNGGFSLRSLRLCWVLQGDPNIEITSPEDEIIGRLYRNYLVKKYGIKFAPEQLAQKFSYEQHAPKQPTFGFHGPFHEPYKEPVILRRSGAMGDIIMLEPVMEWFHAHGYRVVLDCPGEFYSLFQEHFYPVYHISQIGDVPPNTRIINFDMAYEVTPHLPTLESYFRVAGITDGVYRNSYLNFPRTAENTLFERYVVLHVDDTAMAHRNVHGVNWEYVARVIGELGYRPIQVGNAKEVALKVLTHSHRTLAHIIGCAQAFIGIESGPAQIAAACNVRSLLFVGSVNPVLRYPNMDRIETMHNWCPIQKDGCYHHVVSEVGQECQVDAKRPPCITHSTDAVIERVRKFLK